MLMQNVVWKDFSMYYLKIIIRKMAWYKLNTLHLHFTEWSGFLLQSDKFPLLSSKKLIINKAGVKNKIMQQSTMSWLFLRLTYLHMQPISLNTIETSVFHVIRYWQRNGYLAKWINNQVSWILNMTKVEVREIYRTSNSSHRWI